MVERSDGGEEPLRVLPLVHEGLQQGVLNCQRGSGVVFRNRFYSLLCAVGLVRPRRDFVSGASFRIVGRYKKRDQLLVSLHALIMRHLEGLGQVAALTGAEHKPSCGCLSGSRRC